MTLHKRTGGGRPTCKVSGLLCSNVYTGEAATSRIYNTDSYPRVGV